MRGEQSVLTRGKTPRVGSPPLARGTVYRTSPPRARGGITPACAGNRHTEDKAYHGIGDHPRLRGEQRADTRTVYCSPGSPPLARGTGFLRAPTKSGTGITPACAGNRFMPSFSPLSPWDHPRLRGEQIKLCLCAYVAQGSPPLARGTEPCKRLMRGLKRITPACAGNSCGCGLKHLLLGDHPRLRGEQFAWYLAVWVMAGSPPLARGTARQLLADKQLVRITPACAGNSAFAVRVRAYS